MRHVVSLLCLLSACDGGEPFFDCCFETGGRPDSGFLVDTASGTADLYIEYSFTGAADCAEAGVAVVDVQATRERREPVLFSWPCSADAIRMSDVERGEWRIELEAGPPNRTWSGSETYVVGSEDATVAVPLACDGEAC